MSDNTIPLTELNRLVLFTGRVSSVHLKNLQNFPFMLFNDLKEAKLDYVIQTTDKVSPTVFSYDLALNLASNNHLDKRYAELESAVRKLFWKEVKIEVKINGEEVYKSE